MKPRWGAASWLGALGGPDSAISRPWPGCGVHSLSGGDLGCPTVAEPAPGKKQCLWRPEVAGEALSLTLPPRTPLAEPQEGHGGGSGGWGWGGGCLPVVCGPVTPFRPHTSRAPACLAGDPETKSFLF